MGYTNNSSCTLLRQQPFGTRLDSKVGTVTLTTHGGTEPFDTADVFEASLIIQHKLAC
jgi:hypothetical protein